MNIYCLNNLLISPLIDQFKSIRTSIGPNRQTLGLILARRRVPKEIINRRNEMKSCSYDSKSQGTTFYSTYIYSILFYIFFQIFDSCFNFRFRRFYKPYNTEMH